MQVPGNVVDNRPTPYPEGVYVGTLKEVSSRWNDENTRCNFSLLFRDIGVIEGETNPGARPYRCRFPVVWDGTGLVDVEEFDDNVPFMLTRAAGLLSQLALALGVAQRAANGDVTIDMEAFLDALESGEFKDEQVTFEVAHRTYTTKDKQERTSDDPVSFGPANAVDAGDFDEEDAGEAEAQTETETEAEAEEAPAPPTKRPGNLRRR